MVQMLIGLVSHLVAQDTRKHHLSLQILLLFFQLFDLGLHVCFALFCLQRLAHPKGDAGLVESLIGGDRHPNLVSHAKEKKPAFRAVDRHLIAENWLIWFID